MDKVLNLGDGNELTFVADPDFHHQRSVNIGERVAKDKIEHEDGREGFFISDDDLSYLLITCVVLQGFLANNMGTKEDEDDPGFVPDAGSLTNYH